MGLDMYIFHTNRTSHSIDALNKIDSISELSAETPEAQPFLPLREYKHLKGVFSIFHEGAYWRKANAIHGWFVDKVQKGVDDCGYYELTRKHLERLRKACATSFRTKKAGSLKPRGGFFFGSTAIDEWYWRDMCDTIKQLDDLLAMDWDARRFFYHSSW